MAKGSEGKEPAPTYWRQTRLPVYSLAFVLPMVLFYEAAIILVNRSAVAAGEKALRNIGDGLIRRGMREIVSLLGQPGAVMSGLVIVAALVVWQIASRRSWEVRLGTLCGMLAESVVLAVLLAILALQFPEPLLGMRAGPAVGNGLFRNIVDSFGAGVYEEFVFRLVLVSLLAAVVHGLTGAPWKLGTMVGILLAAVVFAGAHHVGSEAYPFTWPDFIFRSCSGVFFGVVYYFRGFGIAAGSHALYDVLCVLHAVFVASPGGSA